MAKRQLAGDMHGASSSDWLGCGASRLVAGWRTEGQAGMAGWLPWVGPKAKVELGGSSLSWTGCNTRVSVRVGARARTTG